jgi:hypothetical protein
MKIRKQNPMTSEEATVKFTALMTPVADAAKALRGRVRVTLGGDRLSVDIERAFGVNANFTASLGYGSMERDGESVAVVYEPRADVCWSAMGRTVANATAALALYREVLELAAEAETLLNEVTWRVAG